MLVGLDFDNTIVCYDRLFHRLAVERGLIPRNVAPTKQSVRDTLRDAGREAEWTELQGLAYGPRMADAEPFPGVKEFLSQCRDTGMRVVVVSHKTRHPYRGEKHDLHAAAHAFLDSQGFYETCATGLAPDRIHLELSLPAKLERIRRLGCDAFIDDLPELLLEPTFPAAVRRLLFDPADAHPDSPEYSRAISWAECWDKLLALREVLA